MRIPSVCSATLLAVCFVPLVPPSAAMPLTALLTDSRDQLEGRTPLPDGSLPEDAPVLPGVELGPGNVPLIPGNLEGVPPNPNGGYMGKILPEGLSAADLQRDLTIDGTYLRRKDLPTQLGRSLVRYCPAGEEAVLLHIVPADAEPLAPAASNPDADGLIEPSDGSEPRDEEPGDVGGATQSAGGGKPHPDPIEAASAAELRALREEVQALREAVEELTKRVDAAQHDQ